MSNRPQTTVTEYTCGRFHAKFRYVEKDGETILVDAYIRPLSLEEVSLVVSFFAGKRIFWNHGEDGTLKLLLNIKVRDIRDFEERFFNFLVENIPSIKKTFSLSKLVEELLAQSWIVHEEIAGFEASKVIQSLGRLEVYARKAGPMLLALKAAVVLYPQSVSEALRLASRFAAENYRVESRFPVFKAEKTIGTISICDASKKIMQVYEEAKQICLEGR